MSRVEQVTLVCDLDGSEDGVETRQLSAYGRDYEIDLCPRHSAEMADALAPYVSAARPARSRRRPKRTAESRQHDAAIRAWGKQRGRCRDRGRIPAAVIRDYNAATKGARA